MTVRGLMPPPNTCRPGGVEVPRVLTKRYGLRAGEVKGRFAGFIPAVLGVFSAMSKIERVDRGRFRKVAEGISRPCFYIIAKRHLVPKAFIVGLDGGRDSLVLAKGKHVYPRFVAEDWLALGKEALQPVL